MGSFAATVGSCLVISLAILPICNVSAYTQGSCKEILRKDPYAPSGVYHIQAGRYKIIEVYCEMGLNGGGYTFLSPASLTEINNQELQGFISDRASVLLRIRRCDGTQPYSVLEQLPQHSAIPIYMALNNFTGYQAPVNGGSTLIGTPYLYTGFIPRNLAAARNTQGIKDNGAIRTFQNCDANANSYIALFPNFKEKAPSNHAFGVDFPFCNGIFQGAIVNPSSRIMPPEYYMLGEFHFGGCGCFTQNDARLRAKCILGFQIGFR